MSAEATASFPTFPRKWADEDTTPTSERELWGWYLYGIAAEVFAVCGVGSFLPVTLEQLARENGVLYSDRTTPCLAPSTAGRLFARADGGRDPDPCLIHLLGVNITTASFAMYTFSIAVFVQALVLVSFSSFADHGGNRKRLLLAFGFTGAVTSMLFLFVVPGIYLVAPILVVIGVSCLGSSFVILNSFLPLLAANHPSVRNIDVNSIGEDKDDRPSGVAPELQLSTKISSKGVGLGYLAAVFVQVLSILLLFTMSKVSGRAGSKTLPLRLVLLLSGVWWFVFTIPAGRWLRTRPGPPLKTLKHQQNAIRRYVAYVTFAWSSLWRTIKIAVQLRQTTIFLLAWFLLSDAVATVSGTAILFARTELKLGTVQVALLSITATTSGILGAAVWPALSNYFKWRTNRTIVACMLLMEIIPMYGLLGYVPIIQRWGVGGLQQAWEIYPLGVIHGMVMGGLSSYCRSFYGQLIPPGSEVAFYALFAITDKGSSAIGPAVVGRIVDSTGHIRPAFWFLAVLIALPMPLIWFVNAEKGQHDAIQMAATLDITSRKSYEVELRSTDHEESEGLMNRSEQP